MTPDQLEKFAKIRKLLELGYGRHDDVHKMGDGGCTVKYPEFWKEEGCGGIEAEGLEIYSYVLGPSRNHYFYKGDGKGDYATFYSSDPFQTALEEVQKWIDEQTESLE